MNRFDQHPHIVRTMGIRNGAPMVRGTDRSVYEVAGMAMTMEPTEIMQRRPELTRDAIAAAISYAKENPYDRSRPPQDIPPDELRRYLNSLHPKFADFNTVLLLNMHIKNTGNPVACDDWALARINQSFVKSQIDRRRFVDPAGFYRSRYVFAYNRRPGKDVYDRFAAYLHNCYADAGTDYRYPVVSVININDFTFFEILKYAHYNFLDAEPDVFDSIIELEKLGDPSPADFDIKLILDRLRHHNDGHHLFRGIGSDCVSDVESDLFFKNKHRTSRDIKKSADRQQFEKEMIELALCRTEQTHANKLGGLVDLQFSGVPTNLIPFTAAPGAAAHFACRADGGEILIMPTKHFKTMTRLEYPVEEDMVLHPDRAGPHGDWIAAQDTVFVYAARGVLERDDFARHGRYEGLFKNVLIPAAAFGPVLEHFQVDERKLYPHFRSYFDARNRIDGVMAKYYSNDE